MLNAGSLILGVGAWFFAVLAIRAAKAPASYKNTFASFGLCVTSLMFQFFEVNKRVRLGDYSAIEDTMGAVLVGSVALVSVTMILNLVAVARAKRR